MKPNEGVDQILGVYREICQDGETKEMYKDKYEAKLMHFLGFDSRKIKNVHTYLIGMGLIREEPRGRNIFIVFQYDKLPQLDT